MPKEPYIKIRYSPEEFEDIKKKADKRNMSVQEYQKMLSKSSKVKIIVEK